MQPVPMQPTTPPCPGTAAPAAAWLGIDSLLVVDDSTVQREHAVRIGRAMGVQAIYEASNGNEALHLLSLLKMPPALMLLDLEMPGMDGVELLEAMARQGVSVPFIVSSNREPALLESVEAMARVLGLPVLAAVQKPLTGAVVQQVLRLAAPGLLASGALPGTAAASLAAAARMAVAAPVFDPKRLAQGIAQGEIVVHYQPKVDIKTGIVRGVEALARWQHPQLGLVGPDHFIGLAEKTGLMSALTAAVLEQALGQTARWNARGLRLTLAVNLSPQLLDRPSLVDELGAAVQRHGLRNEQLVLELTESSVSASLGHALAMVVRLRLKGFGLSIDDYGTGFSSMLQLSRVPFTELKIDRSFVNGASQRKHLRTILESALDMARRLDLQTVAEGVETLEDWRLLQQFGCDTGQGWLIAKAMPAAALNDWLKGHRVRLDLLRADVRAPGPAPVAAPVLAASPGAEPALAPAAIRASA